MVTVDSKGRIVLPSEVREQLGLTPGSEVEVHTDGGLVVVEPEDTPERIVTDLEALIEDAAESRERRRADATEGLGIEVGTDPIAAKQRAIITDGARSDADEHE